MIRSLSGPSGRLTAALLALLVCAGSAGLGHAAWDDPGCDPAPIWHNHAAHHFSGPRPEGGPLSDHCELCHSLRLLHTALTVRRPSAVLTPIAAPHRTLRPLFASWQLVSSIPSRAPPSSL